HLLGQPTDLVIGLDFAFSFPLWFIESLALRSAPAVWSHVAAHGEHWLTTCETPFWGRPGRPRPAVTGPRFRRTEQTLPRTAGITPHTIFHVGGSCTVVMGSIHGLLLWPVHRSVDVPLWRFYHRRDR